jgi:hypothetical protein
MTAVHSNFIEGRVHSVWCSMSGDRLLNQTGASLTGFLYEGAAWTPEDSAEVTDAWPRYVLPLSNLSSHGAAHDEVDDGHAVAEAVERARMADRLGHLSGSVAGNQIGYDANADVTEAREQTVSPTVRCHHSCFHRSHYEDVLTDRACLGLKKLIV